MGILDFLFGKKKEESTTSMSQSYFVVGVHSTVLRSTTSTNSETTKTVVHNFKPFVFESNQHQRYENGKPVLGLQVCLRTIKVEKNVNGCCGYQLKVGDGYIVRMINGDTGQPQMSAKPMRLMKSTSTEILLKGYMVRVQTPFGFQDIDMSDYGLTVSLKDNNVVSCILHMYNRNVDIEYRKSNRSNSLETKSAEQVLHKIQNIIDFASGGLACAARNDIQGEWRNLAEVFNVVQDASGQLLDIPSQYCNTVGSAFPLLLYHRQIQENEDIAKAVVDYAFYLLSIAIDYNPTAILYQKRISLVADSCSFFFIQLRMR